MHFTHYNDDFYIEYGTRVNGPDDKWHDKRQHLDDLRGPRTNPYGWCEKENIPPMVHNLGGDTLLLFSKLVLFLSAYLNEFTCFEGENLL